MMGLHARKPLEDVAEEGFGGLHFDVGKRRADIDAELAVIVTGDAEGEWGHFFGPS